MSTAVNGRIWAVYHWTILAIIWTAVVLAVVHPNFFGPVPPLGIW